VKAEEILKCGEQMPKIGVFAVTEGLLWGILSLLYFAFNSNPGQFF
jgi:hypothetical protein